MQSRVQNLWERLHTSYWFLPTVMVILAIGFSAATLALDHALEEKWANSQEWFWSGGAEGARALLSTIADSMMGAATVAFSITVVALTLATSQFGPRLLRNFMRDTGNQVVFGTFVGTFVYCLLILRAVRGGESEVVFLPHVSITCALVLALLGIAVLIYFIHHIASSLQAGNVVATVGEELMAGIARIYPEDLGEEPPNGASEPRLPDDFDERRFDVRATESGYVQTIAVDGLVEIAAANDLIIRLATAPGDFVSPDLVVAHAWPPDRCDARVAREIAASVLLGEIRTPTQDVEHGVHQLVEIAVRALSPSINDPSTASMCIDRLGAGLIQVAQRRLPSPHRYDRRCNLRVIAPMTTFRRITDAAFDAIRQYGGGSVAILIRLLDTIGQVAPFVRSAEDTRTLRAHAALIEEDGGSCVKNSRDLDRVREHYHEAIAALEATARRAAGRLAT